MDIEAKYKVTSKVSLMEMLLIYLELLCERPFNISMITRSTTKHINIHHHYVHWKVIEGFILLKYLWTTYKLALIFMEALLKDMFFKFWKENWHFKSMFLKMDVK